MYSYQERIRAVQLYKKLGKRIAATRRQLGYPTKNTFKSWYRAYQQCQDLCQSPRRSGGKDALQQQQTAIKHDPQHGRCAAHRLRRLGYAKQRETWMDWLEQRHPAIGKRLVGQAANIELPECLAGVQLARSSCFYQHARALACDKYTGLRQTIKEIFASNHCCYGDRRIRAALSKRQVELSEKGGVAFNAARRPCCSHSQTASLGFVFGGNQPSAREHH